MKLITSAFVLLSVIAYGEASKCGIFSAKTSFPWTVKIRESVSDEVVCMGTIISSRHIVTGLLTFSLTFHGQFLIKI
jgi:hypothetical protein